MMSRKSWKYDKLYLKIKKNYRKNSILPSFVHKTFLRRMPFLCFVSGGAVEDAGARLHVIDIKNTPWKNQGV